MNEEDHAARSRRLRELAWLFLKLGIIGFGGPAAHIAMMEDEVVRRRQWLSREAFLDLIGATNLIPGPNSTEMAIHIGRLRGGFTGLLVAGVCFILPAMLLVMGCGWLYVKYGALPQVGVLLYGVKPVIIAIVAQALWSLAKTAVKSPFLAVAGIAALAANALGVHELLVLLVAGIVAALHGRLWGKDGRWPGKANAALAAIGTLHLARAKTLAQHPLAQTALEQTGTTPHATAAQRAAPAAAAALATATAAPFGIGPLFLFFLKVGSVLFGSGYVLLAFLRADLVERWHWLTESQLLDAIAVGQITPGPVFTTATFIGYILGGVPASLAATIGIFLPAFVFVAISAPFLPRLRNSLPIASFLDGLNVASLALMAVVSAHLALDALRDPATMVIAAIAALLLLRFRINSAWLVLGGALAGFLLPRS